MSGTIFSFNGVSSDALGVYVVKLNSDFTTSPLLPQKEIVEERIFGRDKPYLFGVDRKPLTLKLTLSCLNDKWDEAKRRQVANWLNVDDYSELYFEDNPSKKYYCQYVKGIDLKYTGTLNGYIEVEMRCDSPYPYLDIIEFEEECNWSDTQTPNEHIFIVINNGDLDIKPEMWISTLSDSVKIENLTHPTLPYFEFVNLATSLIADAEKEQVYIDNENKNIETSLIDTYRYDDFNDNFLTLKVGSNELKVTGRCKMKFKLQEKILG